VHGCRKDGVSILIRRIVTLDRIGSTYIGINEDATSYSLKKLALLLSRKGMECG
jgi:hypothetical protein